MTKSKMMIRRILMVSVLVMAFRPVKAAEEPVVVSTEHPRLFLRPQRLRLLRRERERQSMRWQQFDALISGNAPMPEPGFAWALYYQVAGDEATGRKAVSWAQTAAGNPNADLRQLAIVYDWCQTLMSDADRKSLAARISKRMAETAADDSIPAARSRALAAVTLFDEIPDAPQKELQHLVYGWWKTKIAHVAESGRSPVPREDAYPLMELLHAVQDNTNLDLRETSRGYFKDFPIDHLMSYYPAPFQGAENDFYVGTMRRLGDPDLRLAALSRAADLAMVAYDVNAPETQVLQGWLMHDRYMMRGAFGVPYEFLWANPYQPGLSYFHVPLVFYNPDFGRLFARSSWEDDAQWFGAFDGLMQIFAGGHPAPVNPQSAAKPIDLHEAVICFARAAAGGQPFHLQLDDAAPVFMVGLEPRRTYAIEVDDEEMFEATADVGGILELDDVPSGRAVGVKITQTAASNTSRLP